MAEVTAILCPICHKSNQRRAKFCQHCGADMILNNDSPSDHRRYVITRVVKQGGQGAVYEGIDDGGQVYAIKVMLDRFTDPKEREEAIARFNDEAQLLQSLSHSRIPRIYSHFRDEGRHYLTMDFIRGTDLEDVAEREGKVAEAKVLEWADQICDVLVYLHSKGLIYRDMKPSNVMIEGGTGSVKLVDFGITKLFKPTERGTQIGTPGYAPPEQYQGLATPQSDVYALGATLHHILTGRDPTEQMPFSFPPVRSLVPNISESTNAALERALQKVPQDRFPTITEFWSALRPQQQQKPAQVRVAAPTVKIPQPAAAQVSTAPAMAGNAPAQSAPVQPQRAPAPPARPPVVQPKAPQPAPPAAAQPVQRTVSPKPAGKQRRRRGFFGTIALILSWMLTLAIIGVIAFGGYVVAARPAWAEPYVAPILGGNTPANPPALTTQQVSYNLQVTVPSSADQNAVLAEFRRAFEAAAQAEYGPATRISPNQPPASIGAPTLISDNGTTATYQATIQGLISRP